MFTLLLLVACDGGGDIGYPGTKMSDYFPMDGTRIATFANEDQKTFPDNLVVSTVEPREMLDNREVVTLESRWDDDAQTLAGGVKWSVVEGGDTVITAWSGADGSWTTFDTPVQITDPSGFMHKGDAVVTETNGMTFTSIFSEVVECDPIWGADWNDCVHMVVCDTDEETCRNNGPDTSPADAASRPNFVGDYWLVTRYFMSWFVTTGYDTKWNLANHDYVEE